MRDGRRSKITASLRESRETFLVGKRMSLADAVNRHQRRVQLWRARLRELASVCGDEVW
jgi:hypothetical protein